MYSTLLDWHKRFSFASANFKEGKNTLSQYILLSIFWNSGKGREGKGREGKKEWVRGRGQDWRKKNRDNESNFTFQYHLNIDHSPLHVESFYNFIQDYISTDMLTEYFFCIPQFKNHRELRDPCILSNPHAY